MDFTLPAIVAALATIFLLLPFIYNLLFERGSSQKPPQAGGAWPIIGHLHQLASPQPTYKILADMADKYGPIFRLRLGAHQFVVVSDSRIAKQCFTTNDRALAGRPKAIASEIMGYNHAMFGLVPYGQYWRYVRKVVMLELLSNRRLEVLGRVLKSGIKSFTQDIHRTWLRDKNESEDIKLDMKELFGKLIMDIMIQMLFGQRPEEERRRTVVTVKRLYDLLGASPLGDFVPWLRCFEDDKDNIPKDFDADTIVKATCTSVLLAGMDTTAITLTWALSLVLNNYSVLEKIRAELDIYVGRERHVNLSDLSNFTYLHAVVKETLRLYPAGPLLVPHESIDDCVVDGYTILKGTRLLVNAAKIHRDLNFWSNPDVFQLERFLNEHKEIDVKGNHFELIPFGSGRRMCPGISLALQIVELTLASLIHNFNLKRISNEPIDMTESFGLTIMKKTPLYALFTPCLSSHLYC
nr:cytochrome P450 CYP82D47-like [Ipomoea batatas]